MQGGKKVPHKVIAEFLKPRSISTTSVLVHGNMKVNKVTLITELAEPDTKFTIVRSWEVVADYPFAGLWPENALKSYFDAATAAAPSILIFEQMEILFPGLGDMEGSNDKSNTYNLMHQFSLHLDEQEEFGQDLIVVGTTDNIEALHPLVRSRFENEIECSFSPLQSGDNGSTILKEIPHTDFHQIGGMQEIKEQLQDYILWVTNVGSLARLGVQPRRGILLYGPPGTGKTTLARAVAHVANIHFVVVNISDLSQSEVGGSEKALHQLFRGAVQNQPSIIFLDEIDALFGTRSSGHAHPLHSQLMLELDDKNGVFVLAATNRPMDIDPAFFRPGRLDLAIRVPPLDDIGKRDLLVKQLSKFTMDVVDIGDLVDLTAGYTGADLCNLCNQAGLIAMGRRENVLRVTPDDFNYALQKSAPIPTQQLAFSLE